MPKLISLISLPIIVVACCFCTGPGKGESSSPEFPETDFAILQIKKALLENAANARKVSKRTRGIIEAGPENLSTSWLVMRLDSVNLGEQEYSIRPLGMKVHLTAGDKRGLMYGGLEIAEQLRLNGEITRSEGTPFIQQRGIKFNIPLDARTPSYDDSGDAAQENILTMWDWQFWEEFLDRMALNRYNVLSLWNPHPYPSMVKLEEYPEVALDDVCRTTLIPGGYENEWGEPGLVSKNVVENLEVIKEMSIEDKIAFWQKVMQHASDRGIDIYWINWNICPNSVAPPVKPMYKTYEINMQEYEPGKHGITYEISNTVTIDYYRKAVHQFLLTYPQVKGIGVTAGEHMPLEWEGYNREKWLWETYGQGILDAKADQPGREVTFIHRVWHSDMDQIMNYWSEYPDPFQVSFKYAKARLYSSTSLPFADRHIEEMEPYGLKSWWNLRNDDIFVYRWGDPEYVRDFLDNLPPEEVSAGYYQGSDGYVWGREHISKDPVLSGELEIHKHRYRFMLWGRLGYDNTLPTGFFKTWLAREYNLDAARAELLYSTWQISSKIIPLVNSFHWRDWDHHWSVESCQSRPVLGGYRDVFDFIDNPTLEGSGMVNIASYVEEALNQKGADPEDKTTPIQVVDSLLYWADQLITGSQELQSAGTDPEFRALLDDILAQAWLGRYYASKILAATHIAIYEANKDQNELNNAIRSLELSLDHWEELRQISEFQYQPQMLARVDSVDWSRTARFIRAEIREAKHLEN